MCESVDFPIIMIVKFLSQYEKFTGPCSGCYSQRKLTEPDAKISTYE